MSNDRIVDEGLIDLEWPKLPPRQTFLGLAPAKDQIASLLLVGALLKDEQLTRIDSLILSEILACLRKCRIDLTQNGTLQLGNLQYGYDHVNTPYYADLVAFHFVYCGRNRHDDHASFAQSPLITSGRKSWADPLQEKPPRYVANFTNTANCIPDTTIKQAGFEFLTRRRIKVEGGYYHTTLFKRLTP